jgi:hypothetical protein
MFINQAINYRKKRGARCDVDDEAKEKNKPSADVKMKERSK